ncbi:MAG: alpha/beta hydrolase fold protein [Parcubacteria group bacterium Gr01-1014_48]|nr:MAG: alpha/beta hydrolase fold protein [Parcubacteria group bacterium Greene0416_14]TSC72075.1 MAG: alpha/beta hydrolase fold protein [Parcubacteria group bacterium Gr01-1014_48]TSC99740.1 MAG: alpha/beta hydrolase fold protein [Parcubacteria group bacterium Greene1014_15]TSD07044.1 MAG: alpha/beta hydrolase fold protein [Parcubacteria group bacterium Greene0714_4]
MKSIVNNLAVEYEDHGSGSVMLFLHGWKDTLHTFDGLSEVFSRTHRVIALDLPGFGKSELPKSSWGLDEYVEIVWAFSEKLGISVDVIVGHSFGGRIAIKGLSQGQLRAHKVVLIASAGIAQTHTARSLFFSLVAKIGKWSTFIPPLCFWRKTLRKKLYALTGSDYMHAGRLKETFLRVVREDLSEQARKISIPALLLWGAEDTETPVADGKKFAELIHNSNLKIFSDAGHFVHQEKTTEVIAAIKEFIQS